MRLHCLVAVLVTLVLIDVGDGHRYSRYNRQQRIITQCLKSPLVKDIVTRFTCPKPDLCATVDCNCNERCVDGICQCNTGFQGEFCTDIDYCVDNPCGTNGECTDGVNMFSCTCNEGFTGDTCEIESETCTFTRFDNKIAVGGGSFEGVLSLEECEQKCAEDDDCEASYRDDIVCYFASSTMTETKTGSVFSLKSCSSEARR